MKQIVLINQSAGYLAIDIVNALCKKYDKVVLVTGSFKPMERGINASVKIQRIIKYNRSSFFSRFLTSILGTLQISILLLYKYRYYELFYSTNPPMAYLSSLFIKNKFSLIIYDIYPNSLQSINLSSNSFIYKLWTNWNKKLFKRANRIITLSVGMSKQLTSYIDASKIEIIPNWIGFGQITPVSKSENPFIKSLKLEDKLIVLYSGNIGLTHSVETIIEVAKLLEDINQIQFIIIGEGSKKEKLIQMSKELNLKNCIFLTWQPYDTFLFSIASADLSVITLSKENAEASVPSKTYNALAVGSPLLCIAPEESELSRFVNQYQNGICFSNENVKEIAEFIIRFSNDKYLQKELSLNSLKASKDFTYANADKYL